MASQGAAAAPGPNAQVALEQLGAALARLAPKASPRVVPAPPRVATALSRLYEVPEKQVLQYDGQWKAACEMCGGAQSQTTWSIDWDVDVAKQRMSPKRCVRVCSLCAAIRDLPRLIER